MKKALIIITIAVLLTGCGDNKSVSSVNSISENNSPENLQMLSHSEHQKLHATLKDSQLLNCQWCGKNFKQKIRGRQPTCCSKKCAGKLKRSKEIEKRICIICGKEFECNKFQKTQTCSKKCTSQLPSVSKNLFKPKNQSGIGKNSE